jgi:hypothetical protein
MGRPVSAAKPALGIRAEFAPQQAIQAAKEAASYKGIVKRPSAIFGRRSRDPAPAVPRPNTERMRDQPFPPPDQADQWSEPVTWGELDLVHFVVYSGGDVTAEVNEEPGRRWRQASGVLTLAAFMSRHCSGGLVGLPSGVPQI